MDPELIRQVEMQRPPQTIEDVKKQRDLWEQRANFLAGMFRQELAIVFPHGELWEQIDKVFKGQNP